MNVKPATRPTQSVGESCAVKRSGPLTSELVRKPGGFGLGQVPARHVPDATTAMICGFCSTGCSLTVHLKDGEAINLTPTADYPVNLGHGVSEGLGSA